MASQWVQLSTAAVLAGLVYFGVVEVWHILLLSFITGTAQAFGGPAYQSLIPSLVGKQDLTNAIALNSIQFNVARMLGPLLAGGTLVVLKRWGVADMTALAICFGLNALSFLAVILSLMSLHIKHMPAARTHNMFGELKQGLAYVHQQRSIRALMVLGAATAFFGIPMLTLLPVFARDVFGSGVEGYSVLLSFSGAGAVSGAMVVAWLGRFPHMGLTTLLVQACFGVIIALIALSPSLYLTYAAVVRQRRDADDRGLVPDVAGADHRAQRDARAGHEHLSGGVSRRDAARQPRERLSGQHHARRRTCIAFNGVALLAVSVYFLLQTKEIRAL